MNNKNTLIGFILIAAILFGYPLWLDVFYDAFEGATG